MEEAKDLQEDFNNYLKTIRRGKTTNVANQGATFTITETRLYVPVVTLSTQDKAKLLSQLKSGFKKTINWNKYLSKPELLTQNPNLNHLVEPRFPGII